MIYVIITAILIVLMCILFLPTKAEIIYKERQAGVRVFLAGIPVFKLKKKEKEDNTSAKTPAERVEKLEKETKTFGEKIKNIASLSKTAAKLINKYVFLDKIEMKIDVGTGDAPTTAITTGALWGVLYGQLGLLGTIFSIKKHNVNVNPIYDKVTFSFEGKCIFKTRIVYIIIIAITILKKIKSQKGKED